MKVAIGKGAEKYTWQADFEKTVPCVHAGCQGTAELAFVGHEGLDKDPDATEPNRAVFICSLKETTGKPGGLWVHDCMACAVYLCRVCLRATAEFNQG